MKNTNQDELQRLVTETLSKEGMTQRLLATKVGVSDATVDAVKKGRWKDVSEQMVGRFQKYFRLHDWKLRRTENFVAITKLCGEAQENGKMYAVSGYTGAGKTVALQHYARTQPEAYYMLSRNTMKAKSFLEAIQRSIGVNKGNNPDERITAIVEHLSSRPSRPLLIIDDAGKLGKAIWPILQIIYDELGGDAGIVLGGTEYLKLFMDRMVSYNVMGFREVYRRIAYWQSMYPINREFTEALCTEYGIADKGAQRYIADNVKDYDTLRNIIENALKFSIDNDNAAITREVLADLHVGDFGFRA